MILVNMKKYIAEGKRDILNVFDMLKERKLKGYTGIAMKNSFYQFMTTVITNLASLIFLVILARVLLPELFGLYSLALTTIMLFVTLSNLGVGQALVKFVSEQLGKGNKPKAKAYALYLTKIKLYLLVISGGILLLSSKFIAQGYYGKPIFLALLAGPLYIFFAGSIGFMQLYFQAANDFKTPFYKDIFSQILKLTFVPILILGALKIVTSTEMVVFSVVASLIVLWILTLAFFILIGKKKLKYFYTKSATLTKSEKNKLRKFLIQMSILIFSGLFFGYIDIILLGRFVLSDFIGYYRVAFSFIEVAGPLLIFTTALFPIFSRLKGKRLERGFKKSLRITILASSIFFLIILIFAPLIVNIIYGKDYSTSIPLLRILSLLIISLPLTYLHSTYFISKGSPQIVTKLLAVSTVMNVILNYALIVWLINYSQLAAVYGVCIATLVSRYFYLFGLIIFRRKTR